MPKDLEDDDSRLELFLFPAPAGRPKNAVEPDWSYVHRELRKKGVTLQLLWIEYKREHPEGYQYSQFCKHYRSWEKKINLSMRIEHRAGEKMFVDYAGKTVTVVDPTTGEAREAPDFSWLFWGLVVTHTWRPSGLKTCLHISAVMCVPSSTLAVFLNY